MKTLCLTFCTCIALLSISYAFYNAGSVIQELPDRIDIRIAQESEAARKLVSENLIEELRRAGTMADMRAGQAIKMVDQRAAAIQRDSRQSILAIGAASLQILDQTREGLNNRLIVATARAETQLERANASIAEIATVVKPVRQAAEKIDGALPLYTDCDSGVCLFNDIHTTSKSIERTADAIAKEAPATAAAIRDFTQTTAKRSHGGIFGWFRRQK